MTHATRPSRTYDDFAGPELDMSRWFYLEYPPGPDGTSWTCEEPSARTEVGEGTLAIHVDRFERAHDPGADHGQPKAPAAVYRIVPRACRGMHDRLHRDGRDRRRQEPVAARSGPLGLVWSDLGERERMSPGACAAQANGQRVGLVWVADTDATRDHTVRLARLHRMATPHG